MNTVDTSMDSKVGEVCDWLSQQSECTVRTSWQSDHKCCRFYFEKDSDKGWRYVLDIYQGDIEEQSATELIGHLNAAKWRQVLQVNAAKRAPYFKDKAFRTKEFRAWPRAVSYRA
jgi:hypothetical protein